MGSINKVTLVGNLGKDPEVRTSQGGNTIVSFTVATSEQWKDKQTGERREKTEWHRIVVFNERVGSFLADYVEKGDTVAVEGALQTRKWVDQGGQERYTTEIVIDQFRGEVTMIAKNRNRQESDDRPSRQSRPRREPAAQGAGAGNGGWEHDTADFDDAIPF